MWPLIKVLGILCIIAALFLGYSFLKKSVDTHYKNLYKEKVSVINKKHAEDRSGLLSQLDLQESKVSVGKETRAVSDAKIEKMEKKINRLLASRYREGLNLDCRKIIGEINVEFQLLVGEKEILKKKVDKLLADIYMLAEYKDRIIESHVQEKLELDQAATEAIIMVTKDYHKEKRKNTRAKIFIVLLLLVIGAQAL